MNNLKKLSILLLIMNAMSLLAQDSLSVQKIEEVVIIATKYPTASKNIGKIVYKITAAELQEKQHKTVSQVLNEVPGFELNGSNSAPGKNIAAYVRGGKASQVLVVIDGIPVSDPSGINLAYDLNQIALSQILSIEILKGAASTLYGTGAATAVIDIKTKKPTDKSFAIEVGGSIKTNRIAEDDFISGSHFIQNIAISGADNALNYLASYSGTQANGISEASVESTAFKPTDDPFNRNSFLGKIGYRVNEKLAFQVISSYLDTAHDFDGGAFSDVADNFTKSKEYKAAFNTTYKYGKGSLTGIVNYKSTDRDYDLFNSYMDVLESYLYKSNSVNMDVYNLHQFSKNIAVISGIDIQQHNTNNETPYGNIDKETGKFSLIDPYLNINLSDFNGFNFQTGARLNWHSVYGSHTTFTLNPSYNFMVDESNTIKFLGSYSSAYIVPSIYQLYSYYGNDKLTPEKTRTLEAGIDVNISNKLLFSVLHFNREEKNAIVFVTDPDSFVSNYDNDTTAIIDVNGVESSMVFTPFNHTKLKTNYTYTQASKVRTHSIPKHKWNSSIRYFFLSKTNVNFSHQYVSERTQLVFNGYESTVAELEAYHVFDFSVSQNFNKGKLFLSVGVENIFNTSYLETIGYSTKGRNLSLTFSYHL